MTLPRKPVAKRARRAPNSPADGAASRMREDGHRHRCQNQHRWFHGSPTAATCTLAIESGGKEGDSALLDAAACPLCTGQDELLLRGRHQHRCGFCEATWSHKGRCVLEPAASCPWCVPVSGEPAALV